ASAVAEALGPERLEVLQHLLADRTVHHAPHVLAVLVEERHVGGQQLGVELAARGGQGDRGDVDGAELHALDGHDLVLGELAGRVDLDLDLPPALGLGDLLELVRGGGERVVVADDGRELEGDVLGERRRDEPEHEDGDEGEAQDHERPPTAVMTAASGTLIPRCAGPRKGRSGMLHSEPMSWIDPDFPRSATPSDLVGRVLGLNPGMMTGPGTNTYLVGRRYPILIDTGAGEAEYPALFEKYLRQRGWQRPERIILTHRHRDHLGGVDHAPRAVPNVPVGEDDLPRLEPARRGRDAARRRDGGGRRGQPDPGPHAGPRVGSPVLLFEGRARAVQRRRCE